MLLVLKWMRKKGEKTRAEQKPKFL